MAIAAACARSFLRSSSARTAASKFASQAKSARSNPFRIPSQSPTSLPRLFRSPVELSVCVESLLPLHSATAASLMTSMLSVSPRSYGWLSEGQDETR